MIFVVTKKCQSRCRKCYIWAKPTPNELSLEEIEKIAQASPAISWISLTGGEPTLHPHIVEVARIFYRNCPNLYLLNLTTNGLEPDRIENICARLIEIGIPKVIVTVSIDGPPKVNDHLRGVVGDFELATQTFLKLSNIKGLNCYVGMTLFEENLLLVRETFDAIKEKAPNFSFRQMHLNLEQISEHFYSNLKANSGSISRSENPDRIYGVLQESIKSIRYSFNIVSQVEIIYRKLAMRFIQTERSPIPCASSKSSVYLSETGEVFPCTVWRRKLGDVRQVNYDLGPILRSSETQEARQEISKGNCPQCWSPCEAIQSIGAQIFRPKRLL